jgi:hypothetical protein
MPSLLGVKLTSGPSTSIPLLATSSRDASNAFFTRASGPVPSMKGGISIPENPNIRFNYDGAGDDGLDVIAFDSWGP